MPGFIESTRECAVPDATPLGDIPLKLEAVLDRRSMRMKEVSALQVGDVVPLQRSAGENIDIYVNDVLIGYGEIVIIENTMAIRVTDFAAEEAR